MSDVQVYRHTNINAPAVQESTDFNSRFAAKKAQVAASAEGAGRTFTAGLAELLQLQQAEIDRLQQVLRDNTIIPERYPAHMAIGTTMNERGHQQHTLLAVASDRSVWMMENFSGRGRPEHNQWHRVPNLPQAADEADEH